MIEQHVERLPGPRELPLLGSMHRMWGEPTDFFDGLYREYGEVVQFSLAGRRALLISSAEWTDYILGTRAANFVKDRSLAIVQLVLGDGLATTDWESWPERRASLLRASAGISTDARFTLVDEEIRAHLDGWKIGTPIMLYRELLQMNLRALVRWLFSPALQLDLEAIREAWSEILEQFNRRSWSLVHLPLSWPTPSTRRFLGAVRALENIIGDACDGLEKLDEQTREGCLVGGLLNLRSPPSREQIRDEVFTILLAGHETTANAIFWTWQWLHQNPAERAICEREAKAWSGEDITQLRATECALFEGMRLTPPVWLLFRSAREPDRIAGHEIVPRDLLFIYARGLHRNQRHWPEPEKFSPARFANRTGLSAPGYLPFGAGGRRCFGTKLAIEIAVTALARTHQRFRLVPALSRPCVGKAGVTFTPEETYPVLVLAGEGPNERS